MILHSLVFHLSSSFFSSSAHVLFFCLASHFRFDPPFPFANNRTIARFFSFSALTPSPPIIFPIHAPLETQIHWPGELGNAQSAALNASTHTPRVVASASPRTLLLLLLLLLPPPPLPPLPNRGQRVGRPRGLLRHMSRSEPTWDHLDVRIMGRPQRGTRFHSVGPFLPFLPIFYMYPVPVRSTWAGLDLLHLYLRPTRSRIPSYT